MKHSALDVIAHEDLSEAELCELRRLFDSEYLDDFGEWDPEQPYGYAPHDVHVVARIDGRVVGHVGWACREVDIGLETVAIAGVGGVLVSDEERGMRIRPIGSPLELWPDGDINVRGRAW